MKLLLIQPSHLDEKGEVYKTKKSLMPSLTMPYIAALTPSEFTVEIIDDHVDDINFDSDADIIGITSIYTQISRAYQIADEFRKKRKKVIFGGFHAAACPEEVLEHCDSIVIGEAEYIWESVLEDFKKGELKRAYKAQKFHDLQNLPVPRFDLLRQNAYWLPFRPVQTSRGCPYSCEFCSVTQFYEGAYRVRPVEEVVRDVKAAGSKKIFFVDDNIIINREYARKLFSSLIALKIKWISQGNISIAKDKEILGLARQSGCIGLYIGLESVNYNSLKSVNKGFHKVTEYADALSALKKEGITPFLSMIFGFDCDNEEVFKDTLRFLLENRVPLVLLYILMPIPGTKLTQRLRAEGRIIEEKYNPKYFNSHDVLFKPKLISPEDLKSGFWFVYDKFYSLSSIIRRVFSPPLKNLYLLLLINFIIRKGVKKRMRPLSA